jgi:hypothetical protein
MLREQGRGFNVSYHGMKGSQLLATKHALGMKRSRMQGCKQYKPGRTRKRLSGDVRRLVLILKPRWSTHVERMFACAERRSRRAFKLIENGRSADRTGERRYSGEALQPVSDDHPERRTTSA